MKQLIRPCVLVMSLLLAVVGVAMLGSYVAIETHAAGKTTSDLSQVPSNEVGLVLGCSKRLVGGRPNLYFTRRISAAVNLLQAGKVRYLLVSGDNGSRYYDEPNDMRDALLAAGVPEDRIVLDHAGFRTLDSVIRAREVFGLERFTVVSQPFHTKRAVFIASHFGIEAFGFDAPDVQGAGGVRTRAREVLARFKTLLDLYVLGTGPRFLGDPVRIGGGQPTPPPGAG